MTKIKVALLLKVKVTLMYFKLPKVYKVPSDEMVNVVSDPHCYSGDNSSVNVNIDTIDCLFFNPLPVHNIQV